MTETITQRDIANHLDLSERRVRDVLKTLGIDHRATSLDHIRISYIKYLRGVASGHTASDGMDLTYERVLSERVNRKLKELELAEKEGELVDQAELYEALGSVFQALRANLLALTDEVKSTVDAQYGIELDSTIIETRIHDALNSLSRYHAGDAEPAATPVSDPDAPGENLGEALGQ